MVASIKPTITKRFIIINYKENKYKDLFFMIPNSYGTLGYILKARIKLIKAKRFVELTHKKYNSSKEYFKNVELFCKSKEYDILSLELYTI